MSILKLKLLFSLFLLGSTLSACTGAVDSHQIRKGNHSAPEKYKVAESCESKTSEDCKVVISYPPSKKSQEKGSQ